MAIMKKILMICHGNICRSTMAEFVMKDLVAKAGREHEFYIESAATSREEIGNDTHPGTKRKLTQMGVPFTRRRARQVTKADYDEFDYLVIMDQNNYRNLFRIIGDDPENKVCKLLEFAGKSGDIADPWYTGNFDETWNDVLEGCQAMLEELTK
jgi:protein-tyrosine phosphatase